MDTDAPPLVQADFYASQGEQLASRKAFQQALDAHNASARQYQIAAQATSDTTAAKALLLQRDRQLKLASDVARRMSSGGLKAAPNTVRTVASARDQLPRRTGPTQSTILPGHGKAISPAKASYRTSGLASAYIPRERIEASSMADSKVSRQSSSPSASQISTAHPASGESGKASSVEDSYYLLRNDSDPNDPVTAFLALVDGFVEDVGNAVAFASVPLNATNQVTVPQPPTTAKAVVSEPPSAPKDGASESFYLVPSSRVSTSSSAATKVSTKTQEELLAENATLKETLDTMAKQLDWLKQQRQKEREDMRGSVNMFARDVKRQVERVVMSQSTANLGESRRQLPVQPTHTPASSVDSQRRLVELQEQLKASRLECEKQAQQAQHYKAKYDGIRKQIADKRKSNKEAAEAAAVAAALRSKGEAHTSTGDPS